MKVKQGELVAIVGPVACGKTSLLMSILQVQWCSHVGAYVRLLKYREHNTKYKYTRSDFIYAIFSEADHINISILGARCYERES